MILNRIVELQAHTIVRKLTDNQAEYEFIENLIESQKPTPIDSDHHYLIKTPFRYPLPVPPIYASRFKPPFYHRNYFYGAQFYHTSAYEYAYHWLRQRVHIKNLSQQSQARTHFQVTFKDDHAVNLKEHTRHKKIMDRHDYGPSHQFVQSNPNVNSILYPSCRDPQQRTCVVTFKIETLGKTPLEERTLHFIYQTSQKLCCIQDSLGKDALLEIYWEEVC